MLWKTAPLKLTSGWQSGGPRLPIEFARVGDMGELATVLCPGADDQETWWALLDADGVPSAAEALRERERIDPARPEWVGRIPSATPAPHAAAIARWMTSRGLDVVVWTALPPRFQNVEGQAPSAAEAVAYLQSLQGATRAHAESYVRRLPPTLATAHRAAIERALGWFPEALT